MKDPEESLQRFEITGEMDRVAAEALMLEVRRLAKRCRCEVVDLCLEEVVDDLE